MESECRISEIFPFEIGVKVRLIIGAVAPCDKSIIIPVLCDLCEANDLFGEIAENCLQTSDFRGVLKLARSVDEMHALA